MRFALLLLLLLTSLYAEEENYLRDRLSKQMIANKNHFSLMPYKKNYIVYSQLFAGMNEAPYNLAFPDETYHFKNSELQLQVSLMVPLWLDMFGSPLSVYGAYTNRSFGSFLT